MDASTKIKNLLNNKFFRGGFFFTVSNFIGGFLNYLFNSLSGKLLGPVGYGEIAAYSAYLTIFSIPIQIASYELIRRLGQKGEKRIIVLREWEFWLTTEVKKWKFLAIPYFLLILILPNLTNLSLLFSFVLLMVLLASLMSTFYLTSLQGIHEFFWYSVLALAPVLIKLFGPVLVYFHIDGISTIGIMLIFSALSSFVFGKFLLDKIFSKAATRIKSFKTQVIKLVFTKQLLIMSLSLIALNLLNNLDIMYVKKFFTANIAGVYGAWSLYGKIIFYIFGPIISLAYIFFADRDQSKNHRKSLAISIGVFLLGGLIFFLTYTFFGKFVLSLIFNSRYFEILSLLPRAALFGLLYSLIIILNNYFIAKHSPASLTSLIIIPFYGLGLFFWGKTIDMVVNIDLIFSSLILIFSLFFAAIISTNERKTT